VGLLSWDGRAVSSVSDQLYLFFLRCVCVFNWSIDVCFFFIVVYGGFMCFIVNVTFKPDR